MDDEPIAEYLPDEGDLSVLFLACDPVSNGNGGAIYRAFRNGYFYLILDARRAKETNWGWITAKRKLVALRFWSRDARESWLLQVMQSAQVKMNAGLLRSNSGSGNSGAPTQPALPLPWGATTKDFKA